STNVRLGVTVNSAQQAVNVEVFWLILVGNRFVVDRQVIHHIADVIAHVVITVHLIETIAHDMCDLVGEGRVIVLYTGVGARQDRRVTIHVLGTFTSQCRATCCCTDDKSTGELVGCSPEGVTGTLEPEHRVEDVDRDHNFAVGRVRGTRSDHGRGGPTFVNTNMP